MPAQSGGMELTIMIRKLLVLEDEESIRGFIVLNLERAGYEVLEAATGEEALALIKINRDISIAVLDLMLPDIDGYEICRRIRAQGLTMGIIMLTAIRAGKRQGNRAYDRSG